MRGGLSADDCARIRAVRWGDRTGRHEGPSVRGLHPSTTRAVRTGRAGLTLIVQPRCSTTAEKLERRTMRASNVYCTLIETLVKAGIITERTRASFVRWVGLKEIAAEGERMVGDEVAEESIGSLKAINRTSAGSYAGSAPERNHLTAPVHSKEPTMSTTPSIATRYTARFGVRHPRPGTPGGPIIRCVVTERRRVGRCDRRVTGRREGRIPHSSALL